MGPGSDDELAAAEPMANPARIACDCGGGRGHTHHQQYDDNLHDASPSVKNHHDFLAQFFEARV
jgi:hypothetical protein